MKKQTATRGQVLLKGIAMIMVVVMTITCMDLYVHATTVNSSQEVKQKIETKIETEIETTSVLNGEVSPKSVLSKNVEKQETRIRQEKIDLSLQREDPLAGKIKKKTTKNEEETTKSEITKKVSTPEKLSKDFVIQNRTQIEDKERDYEPGVVIVGLKKTYTKSNFNKEFSKLNIKSTEDQYKLLYETIKSTSNYKKNRLQKIEEKIGKDFVIKLNDKTKESVLEAIEILEKNDNVEYAVPNYVLEPAVTPNDSAYSQLWGMDKIQAPQAWDTYTGSKTINVGVLDTGINTGHPDLSGNINMELAYNAYTETVGNVTDYHSHGTHVAGTIGAIGNNERGVAGVNWNVGIVPIKIAVDDFTGSSNELVMVRALRYAIEKEIPICNMSYTTPSSPLYLNTLKEYNGLLIMSAGNEEKNVDNLDYYTALNETGHVVFVASSGKNDNLSSFSNYGAKNVHIAAPGEYIYSTVLNGNYAFKSGTSMATPHVTGTVALIKGKYPNLSATEIKEILLSAVDYPEGTRGFVSTGRLNVYKAINKTSDASSLVVRPNDSETLSDAIRRSIGTKVATNIRYLKIVGNADMNAISEGDSSANAVLPNLTYADLSNFSGILGDRAFENCRNLATVIFPANDFSLRSCSFWYCIKLKTIHKANDKNRIEGEADFTGLTSAESVGLPYAVQVQGFQGCSSLTTIKLPNTHKLKFSIYVFNGCSNLSTIYLDGYPKIIGEADLTEFENVSAGILRGTRINTIKLPKDVAISTESFADCSELTTVQFHPNQTVRPSIGQNAFGNVSSSCVVYTNQFVRECEPRIVISRTNTENIPIKVNSLVIQPITDETIETAIEWYLDSRDPKDIKHLVIKGSAAMKYGGSANILPNLETADLSEFTERMEKGAFYGCSNLKQVIYSASNISIPAWTYIDCGKLQSVQIADKYPKVWTVDLSNLNADLAINTQAFSGCNSIESIVLPSSRNIGVGQYAFCDCQNLSTIYKEGQKKNNGRADLSGISNFWSGNNFKNTGISEVNIPRNVDISDGTFMNCNKLAKIEFNRYQTSVVNIGTQAFYNVNVVCSAYMNKALVDNSAFILPRTATQNIPKIAY